MPVYVQWVEENKYLLSFEDNTIVKMSIDEKHDNIELYRLGKIVGLEVKTTDGLYAIDISKGSGMYWLNKVEDSDGTILDI